MDRITTKWISAPYVKRLTDELLRHCTQSGFLKGQLFEIEELDDLWRETAAEYMVDAVPNVPRYPMVAIAWAGFFGIGMASLWDTCWDTVADNKQIYRDMCGKRGFDELDEYILEEVAAVNPDRAKALTTLMQECAGIALTLIRKENLQPQTIEAFQMYAKTVELMFKIGVSVQLCALGYKYEKIDPTMLN